MENTFKNHDFDRKIFDQITQETLPKLNARLEKSVMVDNSGDYPVLKGDFYQKQVRRALKNYMVIAANSIEEYIALGGYRGLEKAIFEMSGQEVIDEINKAGLRGLGGAGFPTGIKWQGAHDQPEGKKYVIMNADEGDPGAYMDRAVMEGDPHSVIEGMAIAGRAIGSDEGFIYVRAEYPNAVKRLEEAIAQANDLGLLGDNIMGSDFSFKIQLRLGSGAFVCGEGTALMESIEGRRGMPRAKVLRTNVSGLWDKPTVINNVETFSNVASIIHRGADWFKSVGTEDSRGTKVFALVGKVKNSGLVEVPMGTTINEIVYDIGGGGEEGRQVKAVQTGGPSGGCIPTEFFDRPVDFKNLAEIGSIMGSGGMVVMDDTDCMVDIARFFLEFSVDESCGKCTPCRDGTKRMLEMLERISSGQAEIGILDQMEDLAEVIHATSLCGLGQSSCNPVLSTLKYFREEYEAHILEGRCPAGVCPALKEYFINDDCIGCGLCKRECPVDCISGERKEVHHIDTEACIKCNNCLEVCPTQAVVIN